MRRRGFTLLELMLVCIIVATLSAVVAPVLTGSSERTHLDATARAVVALARGARARASAEGRAYFLIIDGDKHEIRVGRARDPLEAPPSNVVDPDVVEGTAWIDQPSWAATIPFEEGVNFVGGVVAQTPYAGIGGSPSIATASGSGANTTTSSLYGPMPATSTQASSTITSGSALGSQQVNTTASTNLTPVTPPVLTYPRICFDTNGTADDSWIDLEAADKTTRVRIAIEAASGRTRILTEDEYKAALSGNPIPVATDGVQPK
jgi:type II secretion system protein H